MSGDSKVYVGGLPADATSGELEDVFSRYGRLRKVWVARRPPGFAFIEFDDDRDAQDAVRALDGTTRLPRRICGVRARVEVSTGRRRGEGGGGGGWRGRSRSPWRGGGGGRGRSRSRSRSPARGRSRSRSPYYGGGRRSRSRSPRRSPARRDSRSRSRSR